MKRLPRRVIGLMAGASVANAPTAVIDPVSGRVALEITGPAGQALGRDIRLLLITKPGSPERDLICIQLLDGAENILWEQDICLADGGKWPVNGPPGGDLTR